MNEYDFIEIGSGLYNMSRLIAAIPLTVKKITDGRYTEVEQAKIIEALGEEARFFDFYYDPDSRSYYAKLVKDPNAIMPHVPVYVLHFDNIKVYVNGYSFREFLVKQTIAKC